MLKISCSSKSLTGLLLFPLFSFSLFAQIPSAAYRIANKEEVPAKILWSIAMVESKVKTNKGRVIPWKYSLNHKGKPYYFRGKNELKVFANDLLKKGETNFDIGIAQINYHWHKNNFSSIDEMINPYENLTYAAQYLKSHYKKTGDWWRAVGLYHSPADKENAEVYRVKVKEEWMKL